LAVESNEVGLLANQPLRRLLFARVLAQAAQNSMLYALLILVVVETGSSIYSTLLIVAFTLPSIVLAVPAGIAVDILPKRAVMVAGNLLRAVIVGALIFYRGDIWSVYLLALAFSAVGQFFAPAESASLPALVGRHQLTGANALMNFVLMAGQVAGMVVLAPFLLKTVGDVPVFMLATLLFIWAAWVVAQVSGIRPPERDEPETAPGFMEAAAKGWELIRTNRKVFLSIVYLAIALTLGKVLVILAPQYTEEVLKIEPEDTVFVAAPAAIGMVAGLALAPLLARIIGTWRVVALGFLVFVLALIGLGLVVYIRDFVEENLHIGLSYLEERGGVPGVITMAMILAVPIGLAFSLVGVGARAVLNQEAPPGMQGRVFATQTALADLASLLPLLVVGAIAELVGVRAMLLTVAILALVLATYLTFAPRFRPPPLDEQATETG
jgi:MFS family permease